MNPQKVNGYTNRMILAPLYGIILFVILYFIAAFLYPGGSQADKHSKGFSWLHNYWCNLLNREALNGEYNFARPVAIAGMTVLCISMGLFWYQFAGLMKFKKIVRRAIQLSGVISACSGFFLFTAFHDIIINVTGILAIFAFVGTFAGLYKTGWYRLFWFGIINLIFIGINNFIYYNHEFIAMLPVVQKISFLSFLTWISLVDIAMYKLKTPTT